MLDKSDGIDRGLNSRGGMTAPSPPELTRDVLPRLVVIGLSEGGVPVLLDILNTLPPSFPAAICAVICGVSRRQKSLALSRIVANVRSIEPMNHQEIMPGCVYIAPDDHHLLVADAEIQLWHGPKENLQRPAVNALFRSAAVSRGADVIGIVLSGTADDGATGLWWIKRYGGITVVQDPRDARFPSMPEHALDTAEIDYCVAAPVLPELLVRLVCGTVAEPTATASPRR